LGHTKDLYRDFALAFWKIARDDLGRAEDAMQEKAFSYAVFHSQQCVEKIVKALLETKEIFSRDHDVSDLFVLYFLKPEKGEDQRKVFYNILDSLEWFKGKWSASRYPFLKDGKVVIPSEDFTEIEASIALTRARSIFHEISSLLKKEYMLEILD
jgi:HEPN domain-containing protein